MSVDCKLETRYSEKLGRDYKVLVIKLTPTYEKLVFLDKAEIALIEITDNEKYNF